MIRVKWRKDGEWFSGVSARRRIWDGRVENAMVFDDIAHFRSFEREMNRSIGGGRWSSKHHIAFVKVKT